MFLFKALTFYTEPVKAYRIHVWTCLHTHTDTHNMKACHVKVICGQTHECW